MLLGELDLDVTPAMGALTKIDGKFTTTTGNLAKVGAVAGVAFGAVQVAAELAMKTVGEFKDVMDLGGTLNDLSLRTGEDAGDLVTLREAFDEAGLGAAGVEPFFAKLQDSIAGLNEDGKSTAGALKALGTSGEALRGMQGIDQIKTLQAGFAGLADQAQRVQVAKDLLGKNGATALSLLGDPEVLGQAGERAGFLADVMDRNAGSFDALGDVVGSLKLKVDEFFAGALSKMAPEATSIADAFSQINFVEIGEGFGTIGSAILSVVDVLVSATKAVSGFLDAIADSVLGSKAPAISEYNKSGVEFRRRTPVASLAGDGEKSPVSALTKMGRGSFGGGGDPLLTESQRHTSLLQQLVDLGRGNSGGSATVMEAPAV